jgi:BarA-like signal transduction histidine kinase
MKMITRQARRHAPIRTYDVLLIDIAVLLQSPFKLLVNKLKTLTGVHVPPFAYAK